jgi:hypothetical protein
MGRHPVTDSSFEDVEIDVRFIFTIMDSSRPLLIDITPRLPLYSVVKFVFAMLIIVLSVCFFAPKDHFVDYSVYRVNLSEPNTTFTYRFEFGNLTQNFTKLWLVIFSIRESSRPRHYDSISLTISADQYLDSTPLSHSTHENHHAMLHYPPYASLSDPLDGISVALGHADRIEVSATVTYRQTWIEAIAFEWSINNPNNPEIERRAYSNFLLISLIFSIVILSHFRCRLEQIGTIVNLALFSVASCCLTSDALIFHIVEQLMIAHLRGFLFYLIAYITNKHRTMLTQIAFALIFMSFALDIGIAWHSWKTRVNMMHGHDIAVHMLLICVIGSIISAMSRSAEDRFSFLLYTLMMALSLLTTLTAHDLCIVVPHFEHFIEPRFLFYGTHAIILAVLVYFHQGIKRSESDGDKLTNNPSDSTPTGIM